ncbi:hypothetical protein [Leucobacter tenebrionis]|nr:hypothetical protein [Leucobacter tenebrionis]QZY52398.1 hypothetical protein KVY00_02720 [Leucobacter tenebrionis]
MDTAAPFLMMMAAALVLLTVVGLNAKKINAAWRQKREDRDDERRDD